MTTSIPIRECPADRHISRNACALLLVAAIAVITRSCAPSPPAAPVSPPVPPAPSVTLSHAPELILVEGYADSLVITWLTHRLPRDLIRGYNVYVSTLPGRSGLTGADPGLDSSLYNHATYQGDTDGDITSESITIAPVDVGTRYHVHVRTVYPDGHLGPPSPEREVIARPQGTLTLHLRLSGAVDGFCFAANHPVSSMSDSNDVYLFSTKRGIFLGSPSRLDAFLRTTKFVVLGPSASIADYPSYLAQDGGADKIPVQSESSIALLLSGRRMAKMRPRQMPGPRDSLYIVFDYVYQPLAGEARF